MKILAIGNSFSQDATRYLNAVANTMPVKMKVVNLYIGGCSLYTHYINMLEDRKNYSLEFNGVATGFMVSIKDALISDSWDVVTVQQVSTLSFNYDSYTPYIEELVAYIKKYSPKAKIYIHQTWAYEEGSQRIGNFGFSHEKDMLDEIVKAYQRVAEDIGAKGIIPSGQVMYSLHQKIPVVHRDTFHARLGVSRFALSLLWYSYLTGQDISDVDYHTFDEEVTPEEYQAAIMAVNEILH